jgi:peptidoglycan/LPS O-acetylase OafA/YrhL
MTLTSNLAHDTPAARRFRRLAPLVVLLGLMALIMAPGFIIQLGHTDRAAAAPSVVTLAPNAPEG